MNNDDKEQVCSAIDNEGFDYCFMNWSDFEEIKDVKFHELRKTYIEAHLKLSEYLGLN